MTARFATMHDVPAIVQAGKTVFAKSTAPLMQYADILAAELGVRDAIHNGCAVIVDERFFVMFSISKVWFSDQRFLIEDIVLRIAPGGVIEDVLAALRDLAKQRGCAAVVLGDSQQAGLADKYAALGCLPSGQQLIMRI